MTRESAEGVSTVQPSGPLPPPDPVPPHVPVPVVVLPLVVPPVVPPEVPPSGVPPLAPSVGGAPPEPLETVVWTLLRRYGVVFRKLLERETLLPPWRDLIQVFRRLEARGEIRGGRFVDGFSGEQYALTEAVGQLRALRKQPRKGTLVSVSAADPLNLAGIVTSGERVRAVAASRIVYRDGVPLAAITLSISP